MDHPSTRDRSISSSPALRLDPAARHVRAEVLALGLARGRPVTARAATVVLQAGRWLTGAMPSAWTGDDAVALAWYGVVTWCRTAGIDVPDDAAAAVRLFGEHLDPDGRLGLGEAIDSVVDPVALTARPRVDRSA